jgi:dUTP pyrophosphatase
MIQVNFIKLRAGAREPVYATAGSAAADLFACLDDVTEADGLPVQDASVTIPAGGRLTIPTGIAIEPVIEHPRFGFHGPHGEEDSEHPHHHRHRTFPDNYVALVFGRSGHGAKFGVTLANSVGVVDSDYRGEIKVTLINHGAQPFTVSHGDRIAQIAFMPVATARFTEVQALGETERGTGGFGSTGR